MTDEETTTESNPDQVILEFFDELMKRQQPLGAEFEKVLNDNLSDLYES